MNEMVKLSQLPDDTIVFRLEEHVRTAADLKDAIANNHEAREEGWVVGVTQNWKPNVERMLDLYIDTESVELFENAHESMWEKFHQLVKQLETLIDAVEVPYYEAGADIEIDISPVRSETNVNMD